MVHVGEDNSYLLIIWKDHLIMSSKHFSREERLEKERLYSFLSERTVSSESRYSSARGMSHTLGIRFIPLLGHLR